MEIFKKRELLSLAAIFLILVFVAFGSFVQHRILKEKAACLAAKQTLVASTLTASLANIVAKAFYLHDFTKNAPLAGKNMSTPLPLASLTKLMTVRMALQASDAEKFHTVVKKDLESDNFGGFAVGDVYSVPGLIDAALIASINDAAAMVAASTKQSEEVFIANMNFEAKKLGLTSLQYQSVTGLDEADLTPTAVGTARDTVMLIGKNVADFPDVFIRSTIETETIKSEGGRSIDLTNTDKAIKKLGLLKASKTGYTVSAGGNLAVVWQDTSGDLLGASVLGSTEDQRFTDMVAIHDAAAAYIEGAKTLPKNCSAF